MLSPCHLPPNFFHGVPNYLLRLHVAKHLKSELTLEYSSKLNFLCNLRKLLKLFTFQFTYL